MSELTAVLGLAQSGVSRHLGLLREAGLVVEERRGSFTGTGLRPMPRSPPARARALGLAQRRVRADRARHPRRRCAARGSAAAAQGELRASTAAAASGVSSCRAEAGRRGRARSACCCRRSTSPISAAAKGYLTIEAARWARRVIAVDRSADVLARAQGAWPSVARSRTSSGSAATSSALPLKDRSVDVALLSQALHHADPPEAALAEAHRILRPGGRVLVLDLREHDEAWVRPDARRQVARLQRRAAAPAADAAPGFEDVTVRVGARRSGDPFAVLDRSGHEPCSTDPAHQGTELDPRASRDIPAEQRT